MTDKVTPTQAVERIEKYLNELAKMRQHDQAVIHTFHGGDEDRETSLNVADIKALIHIARHAAQARAEGLAEGKLIGARLMQEAAVSVCQQYVAFCGDKPLWPDEPATSIGNLDPAYVVKGGDV